MMFSRATHQVAMRTAVEALIGLENLEDRWPLGMNQIEPVALRYLQHLNPAS